LRLFCPNYVTGRGGRENFEFGYDLSRHTAVIEASVPRSSNQVRNIKRDHTEARFRLKRVFSTEGIKVKIKTVQHSAIGIALVFCIKEVFL